MTSTATRVINPFGARAKVTLGADAAVVYLLPALAREGLAELDRLPYSIRVLLENALRHCGHGIVTPDDVADLARWAPAAPARREIAFMPARVVLQDFTGVPCVVDLAAMRDAMARMGGDPDRINPVVPCDLVIDHSVQVDYYGTEAAARLNVQLELERNTERYQLLKFAQRAFRNFRVVPPGTGIVHQVNLEYLAPVVQLRPQHGEPTAYPDTLVGTDSHTTMINGLGVLGWGVGGIEAEAVMLGQPYFMLVPEVVGVKLVGELPVGTTATDLVLRVTEMLRKKGVVDKFVEFFGPGLARLPLADRATIANMAPEYGATVGFFPVDDETLRYLERTGREPAVVERVERYAKEQGLFRTDASPDPEYSSVVELDLGSIEPSVAGPRRPQDRVPLRELKRNFYLNLPDLLSATAPAARRELARAEYSRWSGEGGANPTPTEPTQGVPASFEGHAFELRDGAVAIAAITSCTNTSNPSVMIGAGLLAKKAVERGLAAKPWVKTSMAPGSRVVTDYLAGSGLLPYLERLRFHVVGYGCTTCIGNSGPLPEEVARLIDEHALVAAAVLSGNRNFEARVHPQIRANYLASPMLVVAFALAGRVDIDLEREPLGIGADGRPVFLREIWPSPEEIREATAAALKPELFRNRYALVFEGDTAWQGLPVPDGSRYAWDPRSTYVQEPPFFRDLPPEPPALADITGARVLVSVGNSVTTDHISPAGSIPKNGPAARYLTEHGVEQVDWNTFGSRRGNHEVMMRGTFGNVRIKNLLTPDREGNWTVHLPSGEVMSIYDAAMRYRDTATPLLVLAGKEYGTGSSRDWAAKGPALLGVKAVIAEGYERIHRSNLVGMGILPLAYQPGTTRESLGLTGREVYDITGIADGLEPGGTVTVRARGEDGREIVFPAVVRLNSQVELEYYRHGGILPRVLRMFLHGTV
ncbi:MAG TPA: aconitate hydratase AcnA [Gemmatimonadales bacterium]|nr:aconitate hydratase AcnA [Gemmatimonadales bacterium]